MSTTWASQSHFWWHCSRSEQTFVQGFFWMLRLLLRVNSRDSRGEHGRTRFLVKEEPPVLDDASEFMWIRGCTRPHSKLKQEKGHNLFSFNKRPPHLVLQDLSNLSPQTVTWVAWATWVAFGWTFWSRSADCNGWLTCKSNNIPNSYPWDFKIVRMWPPGDDFMRRNSTARCKFQYTLRTGVSNISKAQTRTEMCS